MEMYAKESLLRLHGIGSAESSSAASVRGWQGRLLHRLWKGHQTERKIRRQIRELQRCDDRTLRDIGISRWEIEALLRRSVSAARGDEGPWR